MSVEDGPRQLAIEPVVFCGAIAAFFLLTRYTAYSSVALTDFLWTLAAFATAVRCYYTANRLADPQRRAWYYLSGANFSWFVGMLIWDYQELVVGESTPFPELSDLGFIGFAILFIPGLLNLHTPRAQWSLTLSQLSLSGILFCCIAIVHIIIFSAVLASDQHSQLYLITALAYPVIYMSTLLFGLANLWRIVEQQRVYLVLMIGFAVHAFTDSFYAYDLLGNSYQVGNAIDVLWMIGFFMIYEAARQATTVTADSRVWALHVSDQGKWEVMVAPTGALLVALVSYQFRRDLTAETFQYGLPFALLLVAFIAIRERTNLQIEMDAKRLVLNNQQKLATLLETIPYGVQENDLKGRITYSNRVHHEILGYPADTLVGHYIWDMQPDEAERTKVQAYLQYLIEVRPAPTPYITTSRRYDNGAIINIKVDWTYKFDANGELIGFISVVSDITLQQMAQERLRQAAAVFENTHEAVMITNAEGEITSVNKAFTTITGYTAAEVLGHNPRVLRSHRHDEKFYNAMWSQIKSEGIWRGEIWNRRKNGEVFPVWQTVSAIRDDDKVSHYVSVFSDISEIKDSQEKLNFLAYHDALTGLPNRLLMRDRLQQAIERASREKCQIAVMLIDLDHFKNVNDSLGHIKGDELLQVASKRLADQVRKEDTVARMGGDEFVVILEDIHGVDDAARLATKLLQLFRVPTFVGEHQLHVTLSIGITLYPKDGVSVDTLIKHADTALYRSKMAGRNCFHFYTEDMTAAALKRLTLESELRHAIDDQAFVVHYQPLIDLASGEVTGVEALIRWQHSTKGMLPPADFLTVAEETHLINPMGEWVLRQACSQFVQWRERGYSLQRLAVNIAHSQFHQDDLADIVKRALVDSGLAAKYLELEISENFVMERGDNTLARVQALKALGLFLAIDDFGTGYSSLNYLKQLPLDRLKIDRSFISDLPGDTHDEILCKAIIGLAQNLGLEVIAEGVETLAQAEFLIALGCTEAQGFLYGHPMSAEAVEHLLRERSSRSGNAGILPAANAPT